MVWYMVWPGGHDMVYGMVCRAWHGTRYGLKDMAGYMVWPGGHDMVYCMAWQTWHCIWYALAGMARYMVCPGRVLRGIWYDMIYGMAWRAWHGICYGLVGIWYSLVDMACYMVWSSGHDMVYGMAWRVIPWLMVWPSRKWHGIRYGLGSWRSCSHVQDPFTSRWTVTTMLHSHEQLLFTLGSDSKLRDCEYISLFSDSTLDNHNYCVLSVDQAFCESLYLLA